jgi:hypothetical protein
MSSEDGTGIDWSLTTFEGARREQLRRWAELPLVEILAALEEMEALSKMAGDDVVRTNLPSGSVS